MLLLIHKEEQQNNLKGNDKMTTFTTYEYKIEAYYWDTKTWELEGSRKSLEEARKLAEEVQVEEDVQTRIKEITITSVEATYASVNNDNGFREINREFTGIIK
jgi:hypothetical protein